MKLRKTVARKPTTAVAAATAGRGWAAGILVALVALSLFSALAPSARAAGTAPQIVSLTYSPASVDVTSGPASVTFTAHLTDGSPITWAPISLVNSAAHQQINAQFQLVSGTAQNGVWQTTAVIPQGAAAGSWDYSGSVQDATTSLGFGSAAWQNQPLPASAPGPSRSPRGRSLRRSPARPITATTTPIQW